MAVSHLSGGIGERLYISNGLVALRSTLDLMPTGDNYKTGEANTYIQGKMSVGDLPFHPLQTTAAICGDTL